MKAMPRLTDKKVRVMLEKSQENESAYNSFFTSVYEVETSE